jgi:hypothetical protein
MSPKREPNGNSPPHEPCEGNAEPSHETRHPWAQGWRNGLRALLYLAHGPDDSGHIEHELDVNADQLDYAMQIIESGDAEAAASIARSVWKGVQNLYTVSRTVSALRCSATFALPRRRARR